MTQAANKTQPNNAAITVGDQVDRVQLVSADGTTVVDPATGIGGGGAAGEVTQGSPPWEFTDPDRVNEKFIYLGSAARTATPTQTKLTNEYATGVICVMVVTAVTATPVVTVKLQGYDDAAAAYYDLNTVSSTIGATGIFTFVFAPGAAEASGTSTSRSGYLPLEWAPLITHGDADSITYSFGYHYVGV